MSSCSAVMGWMAEPGIGLSGDQMTPILVVCPGIAIKPTLSLIFQAKTLLVFTSNMTVEIGMSLVPTENSGETSLIFFSEVCSP